MKAMAKALAKRILPENVIDILKVVRGRRQLAERTRTERIFFAASRSPSYLDDIALQSLQKAYAFRASPEYDPKSLEKRGMTRAKHILSLPEAQHSTDFLELGCWDGMVSYSLRRTANKNTTAIDVRDIGFDERASREGVNLLTMDAMNLEFADDSFDFVFSYDAFEHFASPESVLKEAMRVVKKGGYLFLQFAPLYYSPFGQHVYRSITVPYCQCLFSKPALSEFAVNAGFPPIDFDEMNEWSVVRFRDLWAKYSSSLKKISYHEDIDLNYLSLIRSHPSCFKSKSENFEDFIVSGITVLFQKLN